MSCVNCGSTDKRTESNRKLCYRCKNLKTRYNIDNDLYDKLLKKQDYCCAICKSPKTKNGKTSWFAVDHCHKTGEIRGLLCNNCNRGLGLLEDSVEHLLSAINYLQAHVSNDI